MKSKPKLTFKYSIVLMGTLLLGNSIAIAKDYKILPKPIKVSEHVYAWIGPHGGPNVKNKGFRMNMAFVVGKESIAVIETGFYPAMAKEMVQRIKDISDLPIRYAINTNSQPDRYFGNSIFENMGAKIIAHEKEVTRMVESSNNYSYFVENSMKFEENSVKIPNEPNMPINKNTNIDLGGGVVLEITFYKAAHTPSPLFVHIRKDKVVYAGDSLYSGRLLSIVSGSNVKEWIETFDHLRNFNDVTFIPGHGSPGPLSNFERSTYSYLKLLNSHMTKMVSEDIGMVEAIIKLRPIQKTYSYLHNFKDLSGRNAHRAYQEAELAAF